MRYFELLNLRREPFSNSPDPDLFYRTKQHRECLQALEIAIRLKRGLSVVTGHVGTGKTTLCRQLIRVLDGRQGVITHLILDPSFTGAREFLTHLAGLFGLEAAEAHRLSDWELREHIKSALFRLAVEEDQLVALIVDEGQKIGLECLEVLRELLNYETNEHKLLQIVIFGQLEFEPILEAKANLADRVNLRFRIGPLDFQDTRELIQARLAMCSKDISPEGLFSFWALLAIYLATDGFPRQIVQLCHQALLAVIIKEKPRVTWGVVRSCMRWRTLGVPRRRRGVLLMAVIAAVVLFAGVGGGYAVLDPQGAADMVRSAGSAGREAVAGAQAAWERITASSPGGDDKAARGAGTAATEGASKASSEGAGRETAGLSAGQGAGAAPAGAPSTPVVLSANETNTSRSTGASTKPPAEPPLGGTTASPAQSPAQDQARTPMAAQSPPQSQDQARPPAADQAQAAGASGSQAGTPPASPSSGASSGSSPNSPPVSPALPPAASPPGTGPETAQADASPAGPPRAADAAREQDDGPPRFTGVETAEDGGAQVVDILLSRPAGRFEVSFKPNPARVLVDIAGSWSRFTDREFRVVQGPIDKVRNAIQTDKLRVAIYLRDASARQIRPEVEKTSRGLRVIFK